MNTKHYLTAIFIFAFIFLSSFNANSQSSSDTIKIVKSGLGNTYYHNGNILNFKQLTSTLHANKEAYGFLEKASSMRVGSYIFGCLGGGFLGFSLGHALGRAMVGAPINKTLFFSMLGAGVGFTGIGIAFDVGANKKIKEGVTVYNNALKQKNNANLDLGFSPNGVIMRLNF